MAQGLLFKLKTLPPTAQYLLLKSYLLDRNVLLDVRGKWSSIRCIRAGVFQGNVHGPVFTQFLPLTCRPLGNRVLSWPHMLMTFLQAFIANSTCRIEATQITQKFLGLYGEWMEHLDKR